MSGPISAARLEANRRNAQKSTGPTTDAGKSRSRGNAMKHGLTAQVIDLVATPLDPESGDTLHASIGTSRAFLSKQLRRTMTQLDRTQVIEGELRAEAVFRAQTVWDGDRTVIVEKLALKLSRNPSAVVAELRQTPHGCAWLSYRWDILGRASQAPGGWTEAQTALVFDLLGVPSEGRGVSISQVFSYRQHPSEAPLSPIEIAADMLAELEEQRARVIPTDARERALAQADRLDLPTPALARVRRYEVALYRRFRHLIADLDAAPPESEGLIQTTQIMAPQPVATVVPVPMPLAPLPPITTYKTNPTPGPVELGWPTDTLAISVARGPILAPKREKKRGPQPMPPRSRR